MIALFEFVRGSVAVGVILVGLQAMGGIFAVALDTDDWFFLALGGAVALLVSAGVLWITLLISQVTLAPIATGWLGMAASRHPFDYGADDRNFSAALGSLLVTVAFGAWGYRIWVRAELSGEPFWQVAGLMLIALGAMVGILAAIPRIYFGLHPGPAEHGSDPENSEADKKEGEVTIDDQANNLIFTLSACLMIGMAFARCTSSLMDPPIDAQGRLVAPFGDWVTVCLSGDPKREDCVDSSVRFVILPRGEEARRLWVSIFPACPEVEVTGESGTPIELLGAAERVKLGLPAEGLDKNANDILLFDTLPGESTTIELGRGRRDDCLAGLQWRVVSPERLAGSAEVTP